MLDAEFVRWRGGAGGRTAGAEPRGALRFARPSRATICVAGPASSAERIARSGRICAPRAALPVPTVWRWPPVRSRRAELWRRAWRRAWRVRERRRPSPPRVGAIGPPRRGGRLK